MDDSMFLKSLSDSVKAELEKLDAFESDVINRPQSEGRGKLLEAIRVERIKLSNLTSSSTK